MKIGVISDTHGCSEIWKQINETYFKDVDYIIHAGDILYHGPRNPIVSGYNPSELAKLINESSKPIFFAKGNCDAEVDQLVLNYPIQTPYLFIREKKLNIVANHGDKLTFEEMIQHSKRYGINLFISGHTHVPVLQKMQGVTILNPGSPSLPKGEGIPTVALIENNHVQLINIETGDVINSIDL